jgi:putative phosphoribosyl transferase
MVGQSSRERIRTITIAPVGLEGLLGLPQDPKGIVLFAHGSGSGRLSPRNNLVAQALRDDGLATVLFEPLDCRGVSGRWRFPYRR